MSEVDLSRVYVRDATAYARPNVRGSSGKMHWVHQDDHAISACGRSTLMNSPGSFQAPSSHGHDPARVLPRMRCLAPGCAARWRAFDRERGQ